MSRAFLLLVWAGSVGCGGDDGPGGRDAGGDAGPAMDSGGGDAGTPCESDDDCDDGLFCNGMEACVAGRCAPGVEPDCDDGVACTADTCDESRRDCTHDAEDGDGDGHSPTACGGDDCDDGDPLRYVGAMETCDPMDRDEDCDDATFGVRDADMDSYPDAACCNGTTCGTDCDDTVSAVHPSAAELCSNEVDDDCDGMINEDCDCRDGETRACAAPGACSAGVETCAGGRWSACSITPVVEVCDTRDEDCDGTVDEGLTIDCWADGDDDGYAASMAAMSSGCPTAAGGDRCGTNVTSIAPTTPATTDCADSDGARNPGVAERCDRIDQDCDGRIDEGVMATLYRDGDGDGFGDATMPRTGCIGDAGYVTDSTDCFDGNADVRPGSTTFGPGWCSRAGLDCTASGGRLGCMVMLGMLFACDPAVRRYDYNCDGMNTREARGSSTCTSSCLPSCSGGGIVYDPMTDTCGDAADRYGCSCEATCVARRSSSNVRCR